MNTKIIPSIIPIRKPKVNVITLGCSKNIYDSEVLMGQLHYCNQYLRIY
jgi:ribosomal protein S12 methylthiotransferase